MGDLNLIRRPENRNRPGGDASLMQTFNEAISNLGLVELPLSREAYTWSNKQQNPFLKRLDWFFMSHAWSLEIPGTKAKTLTRDVSDHVPCAISIQNKVFKTRTFRFENFWLEHSSFQQAWNLPYNKNDPTMRLTAKFKLARKFLKEWQKNIPRLASTIENTKLVIQLLDMIEESRDLEVHEWNFRDIL
jgi:hypothetical protein